MPRKVLKVWEPILSMTPIMYVADDAMCNERIAKLSVVVKRHCVMTMWRNDWGKWIWYLSSQAVDWYYSFSMIENSIVLQMMFVVLNFGLIKTSAKYGPSRKRSFGPGVPDGPQVSQVDSDSHAIGQVGSNWPRCSKLTRMSQVSQVSQMSQTY